VQSGILRILIVGLVLLVAAGLLLPRGTVPSPAGATELPEPLPLPVVEFTDQDGAAFELTDLTGDFTLMFFGFTNCPDVCPLTLQVLARVLDRLEDSNVRTIPKVVLVSVDPERDSTERLRAYLANFHRAFIGARATEDALYPLIHHLGISVMKHTSPTGNYNMTHSPQVFVLSPKAEVIAIFSKADDPEAFLTDYLRIRQRYARGLIGTHQPG
jgi:protein SCO1